MGYRAAFLNNAGSIAVHSEVFLHVLDREIAPRPLTVLLAGVGNGGAHELWEQSLPEGSVVVSIDTDSAVESLPIGARFCDVEDRADVARVLKGAGHRFYDLIIDATGTVAPWLWPWLREGGLMMYENFDDPAPFLSLADAVMREVDRMEMLPVEDIMRVNVYGPVVSVEKRAPKVVPYLDVLTGNFCDVIPESVLMRDGVKRAIVAG